MCKIAIDSNILSYFVDATLPDYDPLNDHEALRNEKISTLRIALYPENIRLYILPLVDTEWQRISNVKSVSFIPWVDLWFLAVGHGILTKTI